MTKKEKIERLQKVIEEIRVHTLQINDWCQALMDVEGTHKTEAFKACDELHDHAIDAQCLVQDMLRKYLPEDDH